MIPRKITDITPGDLLILVENNTQERKTLEYKALLPDNSDTGKKEFLADISSLANTDGGDLIFGLKETDGVLETEIGIQIANVDSEVARLENMVRDGIFPRITLEIRPVGMENGSTAIVVRTKASMESPHRVIFKGTDKFYRRNSNGKYSMDVSELRSSFLQSGERLEHIKRFRTVRVSDIKAGDTPFPLRQNISFISVHIVPFSAFNTSFRLSSDTLSSLRDGLYENLKPPYNARGVQRRINLDGVVAYSTTNDPIVGKYIQLYRDGKIEFVDTWLLRWNEVQTENTDVQRMIPMYSLEKETMEDVARSLKLLTELEFEPPFYVFLSLVGTEGLCVSPPNGNFFFENIPITQKELLLPEIVIENVEENLQHKFRPVFDMIWNASGLSQSLNFDADNNLNPNP